MNNVKLMSFVFMLCAFTGAGAIAGGNEIAGTKDTWLFEKQEKGKDLINPGNKIIASIGNISYQEINSNPDRFVIGFDTSEFFTPYKKYFNAVLLTKEQNGIDLKISLSGAQFVAKDPAWATSGKTELYLAAVNLKINFSKPVKTAGVVIGNIQDQDWAVYFYNGENLLKEEKVDAAKNKFAFVGYKSAESNITHLILKRTNTKSKKAGYVDDIAIIP